MANFPVLDRSPGITGFVEEYSDQAVKVANKASGLPVLNKIFTFDPKTFKFTLNSAGDADKVLVFAFYQANKDVPFNWTNGQDGVTYEVIFVSKPSCQLAGTKDLWRIVLTFRQYSPV